MAQERCPFCLNLCEENICPHCGGERDAAVAESTRAQARAVNSLLTGRYQIGRVLSVNGEGITYLGYDIQDDARVVIREYFPKGLCTRQADGTVQVDDSVLLPFKSLMFDFTDIYKAVAENPAEGLQKVREIFLEEGTAYVVCELYDLPTLGQYVRERGAMPAIEARRVVLELCAALTPVHRVGMIHGGVSPSNIFIDEESNIVLTGFSTLSLRTRGSGIPEELYPGFSAPEQYEANLWQGSWTDVYGIGAVAYYMLTGRVLPAATERRSGEELSFSGVVGAPGSLLPAVGKALQMDSAARIQSIEELSAAILQSRQGDTSVFSIRANETLILDEKTRVIGKRPAAVPEEKTTVLPDRSQGPARRPRKKFSKGKIALLLTAFAATCCAAAVLVSVLIGVPLQLPSFDFFGSEPSVIDFPEPHTVPSLVGRYVDSVTSNAEWEEDFQFSIVYEYDDSIPEGIIIEQAPDPGVKMINRGIIILTVSQGSRNVQMPGLVGSQLEFALKTLGDMGIRYEIVESDAYAPGIVGQTSVVEGQTIDKTTDVVTLTVGASADESEESDGE